VRYLFIHSPNKRKHNTNKCTTAQAFNNRRTMAEDKLSKETSRLLHTLGLGKLPDSGETATRGDSHKQTSPRENNTRPVTSPRGPASGSQSDLPQLTGNETEEERKRIEMVREEARLLRALTAGPGRKSGDTPAKKWTETKAAEPAKPVQAPKPTAVLADVPSAPPATVEGPEERKRREQEDEERQRKMAEKEAARLAGRFGKKY
jgi:hypothetical protein